MPAAQKTKLKLVYEGSVKRVFAPEGRPGHLLFQFTDDYSVFDWGKMPDTIANKGRALTVLGGYFFEVLHDKKLWVALKNSTHLANMDRAFLDRLFQSSTYKELCQHGLNSHFIRLTDESSKTLTLQEASHSQEWAFMEVLGADVHRPKPTTVLGHTLYHYPTVPPSSKKRLIPLEVVFRFGMPSGSSLQDRLKNNPDYARELGLNSTPEPGNLFDKPVIEFFTKLEPKDRLLSMSEALQISTLNAEQFGKLADISLLAALGLYHLFAERGIELWDGKFEFILDGARILIADSIGPDELRLIYKGWHLSKEMIRQVYRGTPWEQSLKTAQKLAVDRRLHDWKEICTGELKSTPEPLPAGFKAKIDQLYGVLANHVTGQNLFTGQPTMQDFVQSLSNK